MLYNLGIGCPYVHIFKSIKLLEILNQDACVFKDGVRGGSSGNIYSISMTGSD